MRRFLVLALLASLSSPAIAKKAAWAEVDGSFANPAHADEVDLLIQGVNDKRYTPMRSQVTLKPGPQWLTVASTRASGGGTVTAMPYVFKAEPCTRYLLAAQHEGISKTRFRVVVVAQERIGECTLPEGYVPPPPIAPSVSAGPVAPAPTAAPVDESPTAPAPAAAPPVPAPAPTPPPADESGATQY